MERHNYRCVYCGKFLPWIRAFRYHDECRKEALRKTFLRVHVGYERENRRNNKKKSKPSD
jgi:hypothetical protein